MIWHAFWRSCLGQDLKLRPGRKREMAQVNSALPTASQACACNCPRRSLARIEDFEFARLRFVAFKSCWLYPQIDLSIEVRMVHGCRPVIQTCGVCFLPTWRGAQTCRCT